MSLKRLCLMMIGLGIGAYLMLEVGFTKSYGQIAFSSNPHNGELAASMLFAVIVCLATGFFIGLTLKIAKTAIEEQFEMASSWFWYIWSMFAGFLLMAFAMTMVSAWRTESTANASLLTLIALSAMYGTLYCAEFFDQKKSDSASEVLDEDNHLAETDPEAD